MRIAILNIHFGIVERGAEVWTSNISSCLGKKIDIDVYSLGFNNSKYFKNIQIKNVPFIKSGLLYDLSVLIFTILCLPFIFKNKYDWIIPVNGRLQTVMILFLRKILNFKIMIVGHAGIGRDDKINLLLGIPDVFVALSRNAFTWAEKIKRNFTRVIYIPNGVDTDLFNPAGPKTSLKLESPVLLTVSELLPYKRIKNLIQAVNKVKNLSLLVIGKGQLENEIDNLAKSVLGNRYQRIPQIAHNQLPAYYRSVDLFSLPSKVSEAFGLVYLEAIACNIPVVAPDDENRRNLLGVAAIYTDTEDPQKYGKAIEEALMRDFFQKPRHQALGFSWDKVSKDYLKIFAAG